MRISELGVIVIVNIIQQPSRELYLIFIFKKPEQIIFLINLFITNSICLKTQN